MFVPCFVLEFIVSFNLCSHLHGGKECLLLYLYVFLVYCDCLCYVAFPHGGVGCSAVCDCGIS